MAAGRGKLLISKENKKIIFEANLLENFGLKVEKGDAILVTGINTWSLYEVIFFTQISVTVKINILRVFALQHVFILTYFGNIMHMCILSHHLLSHGCTATCLDQYKQCLANICHSLKKIFYPYRHDSRKCFRGDDEEHGPKPGDC